MIDSPAIGSPALRLPNQPAHSIFRRPEARWLLSAFVLWGSWNAMSETFPFYEDHVWPTWYVYGWPICFATSGRGRLNFVDFSRGSLILDVIVGAVLVTATFFVVGKACRTLPRISLGAILIAICGASFLFAFWAGRLDGIWGTVFGAQLPADDISAIAGNAQPISRLGDSVVLPISVGIFCVGCAIPSALSRAAQTLGRILVKN